MIEGVFGTEVGVGVVVCSFLVEEREGICFVVVGRKVERRDTSFWQRRCAQSSR